MVETKFTIFKIYQSQASVGELDTSLAFYL